MATVTTKTTTKKSSSTTRCVIKSSTGLTFKAPYAPRTSQISQDGALWTDTPRPGRYPVARLSGMKPRMLTMDFLVVNKKDKRASIYPELATLTKMARSGGHVAIIYTSLETGSWKITEFSLDVIDRNSYDNPIQAMVHLTFRRLDSGSVYTGPAKGGKKSSTKGGSGSTKTDGKKKSGTSSGGSKRYTVKKGDTLWDIAIKYYGSGTKWRRIADANKIKNPRTLPIGKVLIIP